MAKFTTFDAPIGAAGPAGGRAAAAADFGGSAAGFQIAGKALENFATDLQKREERADVTRIDSLQSTAMAELTGVISKFETAAELGAPGHVDQVTALVKQYYEDRADQATTEAGRLKLQKQQAAVLAHFTRQAIGFQAVSVGAKVKADFNEGLNNDLNTLLLSPDQATFDLTLQGLLDKINDPRGAIANGLEAVDRQALSLKATEALTKARVQGLIRIDPQAALDSLEAGDFNNTIDNDDVKPLMTEARVAIRAEEQDVAQVIKDAKDAEAKAQEAKTQEFMVRLSPGSDQNPPTHLELAQSGLKPSTIRTLQADLAGRANFSIPGALNRVVSMIHEGTIRDVETLEGLVDRKTLSFSDFKLARTELVGDGTPQGQIANQLKKALIKQAQNAHAVSNDLMNLRNPEGDKRQLNWLREMLPAWSKAITDGIPATELVNEKSPHYLGGGIAPMSATDIMGQAVKILAVPTAVPGGNEVPVITTQPDVPDINKAIRILRNPTTNVRIFQLQADGPWFFEDGTEVP